MAKAYIQWVDNDDLTIEFSEIPHVCIRYILPSATDHEKASIKKYPFINKRTLEVRLYDKEKEQLYEFTIPKNYCFDGATVPRFFWRIIGPNTDNKFLIAALAHDVLCENHAYVDSDREFSTLVFDALLEVSDVNPFKRWLMKNSVDLFQRFCNWD